MKKGIIIGIVFCLCMSAVAPVSRHWQNEVPRLSQQWLNVYGYDPHSVLAYSAWKHERSIQMMEMKLKAVEARLARLEKPVDPNDNEQAAQTP